MTVVGYLDKHHSIGELGRLAIAGVQAAGIPFQPVAVELGDGYTTLSTGRIEGDLSRTRTTTRISSS